MALPTQYTVAQVAEYFHRDEKTIRRWIAEGKFPHAYRVSDGWKISREDIRALAHRGRRRPPAQLLRAPSVLHEGDVTESIALTPLLLSPSVYFLVDRTDAVLYIGQSTNLLARIAAHLKKIPGVSRIFIKTCPCEALDATEQQFIIKYRPPYNIVLTTGQRIERLADGAGERITRRGKAG